MYMRRNLDPNAYRLILNGEVINGDDTAADLDLNEGDVSGPNCQNCVQFENVRNFFCMSAILQCSV